MKQKTAKSSTIFVLLLLIIIGAIVGWFVFFRTSYAGPVVGSKNSDVYHYPDCKYAKQISPENKITFNNASDARAHGYRPCESCRPP